MKTKKRRLRRTRVCDFAVAGVAFLLSRIGPDRFVSLQRVSPDRPDTELFYSATVTGRKYPAARYETTPQPSLIAALQEASKMVADKTL